MDEEFIGRIYFGEIQAQLAEGQAEFSIGNSSPVDIHLTEIPINLDGGVNTNKNSDQPTDTLMNSSKGTSRDMQNIERDNTS
ncbi:hypothetical protein EJD97_000908, partial [Solanum chilense]